MNTLEATVLVQSLSNLVAIEYGSTWDKNKVSRSNPRKPCGHARGHSFGPIFIKLGQDRIWIIAGQNLGQ